MVDDPAIKINNKPNYVKLINYFAILLAIIVVFRWWYYVYTYSVNVLYWDQWDFYDALFSDRNLWELFSWQHGPQRLGLGLIFTKIIADLSGWNTRYEGFAVAGIMCISMVYALILKNKLFNAISWSDVSIALIFLSILQYDIFVNTVFLAHGALPVLLILVYCSAWILDNRYIRYPAVLLLNFLSLYTGNAVLIGFITPVILLMELYYVYRVGSKHELFALITAIFVSVGSIIVFFHGYIPSHIIHDFKSGFFHYWNYPLYISNMFAKFIGLTNASFFIKSLLGFIPLFILLYVWTIHFKTLLLRPTIASIEVLSTLKVSWVIFILISFSFVFCIIAAMGRVYFGAWAGACSRYVTLLIPGFFGLYLHLVNLPLTHKKNILLFSYVFILILATFPLRDQDYQEILLTNFGKTEWVKYYLRTEDLQKTNQTIGWKVYPHDSNPTIKWKLDYLKANKLNLYLDSAR